MTRIVQLSSGADARISQRGCASRRDPRSTEARPARCPARGAPPVSCSRPSSHPRFPGLAFVEVRYRIKTWNAFDSCMADGRAALDLVARPTLLVGFSMGGAVSIGIASHSDVTGVLGLAPWIPRAAVARRASRKAARRAPRLLGSLSARDPRRQRGELEAWASSARRRSASRARTRSSPAASTAPRSGAGQGRSSGFRARARGSTESGST